MADEALTSNQGSSEAQTEAGEKSTGTDATQSEATSTAAAVSAAQAAASNTEAAASAAEANESSTKASAPRHSEPQPSSPEILDSELESIRPLAPSMRLNTAKDSTIRPINVRSTLPSVQWPPKVVADLMTRKIITVEEHEAVGNLEEWMHKFKFHHLPVVDSKMKLIGLISRIDFLHAELGKKPDGADAPKFDADTQAGDIMRKNVVIARLDSPVATACRVMLKKELACLPVVLEDGTLVGILTKTDFVKLSLSLLEAIQSPSNAPQE